jgi:hypothetical protein
VQRKLVCRTFSDCTTAPRKGLISGCYPLDRHYKDSPEAAQLAKLLADNPTPSSSSNPEPSPRAAERPSTEN